jgi:hypothetical protein
MEPMRTFLFAILFVSAATSGAAQAPAAAPPKEGMGLFTPDAIQWKEGPATLAKGAKMTVLEGDPTADGMFTMRLFFPDGFQVMPHWHSQIEHVTVISGTLNFGMGEKFNRAATRPMKAGSFGFWPIGMRHFAWTTGDTVLQLHGRGPWTVTYVNPADDPRRAAVAK